MLIVTTDGIQGKELEMLGMVAEAEQLHADAIVGTRYATSGIMQSAAEVMAYGTAVRFR